MNLVGKLTVINVRPYYNVTWNKNMLPIFKGVFWSLLVILMFFFIYGRILEI